MRPPHHEFFQFQFTHPGRGATGNVGKAIKLLFVSIHAPREGCDFFFFTRSSDNLVSIHAPREGCDSPSAFQRGVR